MWMCDVSETSPRKNEPGALPAREVVALSVPSLQGNEWTYVKECLDTNWVSSVGPFVDRFEEGIAKTVGARHATATINGTAALHTALLVAGIGAGDEVVVSDLTFVAPANAVRYVGAWPVFVDAEPEHWQMDPQKLADFLERDCVVAREGLRNRHTGRIVRAIMPVHVLGHPCEMDSILELAHRFGLLVIEDASESLGASYGSEMAGHLGDMACFSFNGNKIMTTGGGGMIVTDNAEWAARARYLTTQAKDDPIEFVHDEIGYNYRLTNVLAAIGCAQLERLDAFVASKRATARDYTARLSRLPGLTVPREAYGVRASWWQYTVLVDQAGFGQDARSLMRALEARRIQTRPLWQPMHLLRSHQGSWATDCSVAERLKREGLSLPSSVSITEDERDFVVDTIRSLALS